MLKMYYIAWSLLPICAFSLFADKVDTIGFFSTKSFHTNDLFNVETIQMIRNFEISQSWPIDLQFDFTGQDSLTVVYMVHGEKIVSLDFCELVLKHQDETAYADTGGWKMDPYYERVSHDGSSATFALEFFGAKYDKYKKFVGEVPIVTYEDIEETTIVVNANESGKYAASGATISFIPEVNSKQPEHTEEQVGTRFFTIEFDVSNQRIHDIVVTSGGEICYCYSSKTVGGKQTNYYMTESFGQIKILASVYKGLSRRKLSFSIMK